MLGHSHALSGLAAGAATLPFAPVHTAAQQTAWVAAWGGFAMLPDLDQRGATIGRMWGGFTEALAGGIATVSRGHRNGTHDAIIAPVVFGAIAWLAGQHPVSSFAMLAFAIGLALRACNFVIPGRAENTVMGNLAMSGLGAWWITASGHYTHMSAPWLPVAVAGGVLVHIAGDWLTVGGIPVPFTWFGGHAQRVAGRFFKTGSPAEHFLAAPAFLVATVYTLYRNTGVYAATASLRAAIRALG
ncbi:MAG: metal-dependent hydrolase [Oryzihumus sp.]